MRALARRILRDPKASLAAGFVGLLIGAAAVFLAQAKGLDRPFAADADRARIEEIVRDYIFAHPDILPQAMDRLHDRETAKVVDVHRAAIETPFAGAWAGARNGDVTLVEFFDYACPYCRVTNVDVARLLKEDSKLKVVWRELPVLGEDSVAAAQVSLAAAKQGRFRAFHDQLFGAGRPTQDAVAAARKAAGVTAVQSAEFGTEIDRNFELARALSATGTPTFVVGDKVLGGAVGYDALKEAIAEVRKSRS